MIKEFLTIKNILILIASIYLIVVIERLFDDKSYQNELIMQHIEEKAQMQTKLNTLNNKIHTYEIQILKNNADVDGLSDGGLDSLFTSLFNSQH